MTGSCKSTHMLNYAESSAICRDEIILSLTPSNHTFFHIPDLSEYADKIFLLGKCTALRNRDTNMLASYILYYDNGPEIYISMVWTNPLNRRQGLAAQLINKLQLSPKDILLEVNPENPAKSLYQDLKFAFESKKEGNDVMRFTKRLAVMQPYIFPYLGYFHLLEASDHIVFYDDVNYIKSGWINRNRILLEGREHLFTVSLKDASSFKTIKETMVGMNIKMRDKFFKQLQSAYAKAPHYDQVCELIAGVFARQDGSISDMAIDSIESVYRYLGKDLSFSRASLIAPETKELDKSERLIHITKKLGYDKYVNPVGGMALYDKDYFSEKGIVLSFVKPHEINYSQFGADFIPWLSIIDVLMFNDKKTVSKFFTQYQII